MKVLVLGASGMLGHKVANALKDFDLIAPTRQEYNAPDSIARFGIRENDWVINCIGIIPQKNTNAEEMQRINADFPRFLAMEGSHRFIQIATDCVFKGDRGGYSELSSRDATDNYGNSKKLGESVSFMNLRTSIIGSELTAKKSLFEWVKNQPKGATIKGFVNHYWNGITTDAFARIVRGIIKEDLWIAKTQHVVPEGQISKYELIKLIARRLDRDDLTIIPTITNPINRTLKTVFPHTNLHLWDIGGYFYPPSIEYLIEEMAVD